MKNLIFAVGLSAFLMGATSVGVCAESLNAVMLKKDNEQRWRECSGPNGERDPSALPLYEAIFARDKDKVSALLEQGASPNSVLYPKRWSPLMLATAYNDHDIVSLLVKHGANINYVSNDPATGTPLAAALEFGRFYKVEHPNDYLADSMFFDTGSTDDYRPDFSIFYYLFDSGADVNLEFRSDWDIANDAASAGNMAIVTDLLARGYRRDLPGLKRGLEGRVVPEKERADKEKALAAVNRILAEGN